MRSGTPKVLHPLCGRPMVLHVVDALAELPLERIVVVVGHGAERVDEDAAGAARHRGAGRVRRAARAARHRRRGERRAHVVRSTISTPKTTSSCCPATTPLAARRDDRHARDRAPRAGRGGDDPHRDASPTRRATAGSSATRTIGSPASSSTPTPTTEEREIDEINTSIYCFRRNLLAPALRRLSPENAQGEYYLTDAIEVLRDAGHKVIALDGRRSRPRRSGQRPGAARRGRGRAARPHQPALDARRRHDGRPVAHLHRRDASSSSPTCACCRARSSRAARSIGSRLGRSDPTAASTTSSSASARASSNTVARECEIGDDCEVGPFAYLRPGHPPGRRASRSGTFVEIKNSEIGEGTKVPHLSYVGDADIGAGVEPRREHDHRQLRRRRTSTAPRSATACTPSIHTSLVAPVELGDGCRHGRGLGRDPRRAARPARQGRAGARFPAAPKRTMPTTTPTDGRA